jgi:hypothetical protein
MFTHPALLRQLTVMADLVRKSGEGAWARRILSAGDRIRKLGWCAAAKSELQALFDGEPKLESLNFGSEHERRLGGASGCSSSNTRLMEMRNGLRELMNLPLREAPDATAVRAKSPDLA